MKWAPTILAHSGAADAAATKLDLENDVTWLLTLAQTNQKTAQGNKRWSNQWAVQYFRAASFLQDVQALPAVIAAIGAAQLASQGSDTGAAPLQEADSKGSG